MRGSRSCCDGLTCRSYSRSLPFLQEGGDVPGHFASHPRLLVHHVPAVVTPGRDVRAEGRLEGRHERVVDRAAVERIVEAGGDKYLERRVDLHRAANPRLAAARRTIEVLQPRRDGIGRRLVVVPTRTDRERPPATWRVAGL